MADRFAAAQANAVSFPAATCGITVAAEENITWVRPARRSVTAGGAP